MMYELGTLFKRGAAAPNMTPLLKTLGWDVCLGETRCPVNAWTFGFSHGLRGWSPHVLSISNRVFAVRSRGDR